MSEPHSPYAAVGSRLVGNGYSAIPIAPGEKHPGRFVSYGWQPMGGWSKFCGELPPAFHVASWSKWPNAGVGIALGRGVVCVDIDSEDVLEAVRDALPEAVVGKRGAKGVSLFFRGNTDKIKSRSYRISKVTVVDLLAHGRQTVLPPSIHPGTGQPYVWTTEQGLDTVAASALTPVPDNLEEILADVLTPFGFEEEPTYSYDPASVAPGGECEDGLRFYREMNEKALQHFGAWVPPLGLPKTRAAGPGKFEAVASWRPSSRGRPDNRRNPNLKFHAQGIKDMGTGETYTALNVVMKAGDMTLNQATTWLGTRLGYNFDVTIDLKPTARPAANDIVLTNEGEILPSVLPEAPSEIVEAPPPVTTLSQDRLGRALDDLTRPPGLVGEIVDWIEASSRNPCRLLALGATLTMLGTIAGRIYEGPTDVRTNVYIVGLAITGFGKEHARKCVKLLAAAAGLTRFIGGERIMSASGLRKAVEQQPSILYMLDEFAGVMRQLNDPRAGAHVAQIRDYLLAYFGSAQTFFNGSDYAETRGQTVYNPNVSIYGTTTPEDLWDSMEGLRIADGFLPRFVIMEAVGSPPDDVEPRLTTTPPKNLIEAIRRLASVKPLGGSLAGATHDGTTKIQARRVPWAGDAGKLFLDIRKRCKDIGAKGGITDRAIWSRVAEISQSLALIVAIGRDFEQPEIWPQDLEWAFELVSLCAGNTLASIEGRLAENDRQREYFMVRRFIFDAERDGIEKSAITAKVRGRFDTKRIAMILSQLEEAGEVYTASAQNPKGGPPKVRFFRRDVLAVAA